MRGAKTRPNLYGDPQRPVMGDPRTPNPKPAEGVTGHGSRLLTPMSLAAPVQQLTPDQRYFRDSLAQGRWTADFDAGANAPLNRITRHPDGTLDTSPLEPDGAEWIDLGGRGATDVAIGRP
jgi:hypothetical protein